MKFKDAFLINERKVELDGKTFKSEKEAGFYLGSIGKTYEEIMKLLDVPERMAKYYANTWRKNWKNKPNEPEPIKPEGSGPNGPTITSQLKTTSKEQKLINKYKPTPLVGNFDISIDLEMMKNAGRPSAREAFEREQLTGKSGEVNPSWKNDVFAVGLIRGKPIYTLDDIPHTSTFFNEELDNVVKRTASSQQSEVKEALKNLPQDVINIIGKSKTFKDKKVFIKPTKKTGGECGPIEYEIRYGRGYKYTEQSYATLRHELFHMLEGSRYSISYKIPKIAIITDAARMKSPSEVLKKKVTKYLDELDYGLHRSEADKILANYGITTAELEKFVNYDKSNTFDMKGRGALAFALYLSNGDITNAMKSLYQTQVRIGLENYSMKWVNSITHNELIWNAISDFIGSLTRNKVLGKKHGGFGHSNAYYKKRENMRSENCELIATYGAIIGCGEGEIAKKLIKAFAPYTVNAIETILKTQEYFNNKGEVNVDYI